MSSERVIDNLRKLVGQAPAPLTGTVFAVDAAAGTCDVNPSDGGAELLSVRLRAVLDDRDIGLLLLPALGADVLLLPLDADTYAVVLASELSEARIQVGSQSWVMDAASLKMNGGQLGGLVLVNPLVAVLNAVIAQLNALSVLYATHIHPVIIPGVPPAPAPFATAPTVSQPVLSTPSTSAAALANPQISQ